MKSNNSKFTIYASTLFLVLSLFLILILASSCDTTDPQSNKKLSLEFEDASCTEAWLNLKTENISLPTEIEIIQNDSTFLSTSINTTDTILFIENLQPSSNYNFTAKTNGISSSYSTLRTMDTTSHNFTWETFTFGGGSSSYFNDVAIINENNIWAVGEIHTEDTDKFDSNGVWVTPYNAIHWDGNTWELKKIFFYIDPDQPEAGKTSSPCQSIFVFDEDNFIISSSVQIAFMNSENKYTIAKMGFKWEDRFTINSIWGTSSQDFYVVGNGGNIAYYNRSSWRKIESGTEKNIYDIYGDFNSKTNKYEILAVASNRLTNTQELDILTIVNNNAEKAVTKPIAQPLLSLWFKPNRKYYLVGSGIYTKNRLGENNWKILPWDISIYFKYCIVAQEMNDIIITGAFNEVLHFNGINWKSYRGKELPLESGRLTGADYKKNIICIVGQNNSEGIIHIGKK